ncbi:MAG: tetraacyldisaccharide 4'-kinase [Desulfobulbaceae bacterium]|nr:tetraacyldisaccharide 4'-kinase [Desulfobulbaceae bacterium]
MKKKLLYNLGRPFSPLYGILMRFRESCYQRRLFKTTYFPVPVISVGNLTLGGTGKTPMVQNLARLLMENGFRPAVVSRGYGGATKEPVNVVSDGEQILLPAEFVGDEPRLLAETLPGVPVLTGIIRKLPARRAVEMGANVLLLDDGFQHMAVGRDLNLVLFSADFLAGNSRIFPGGDLREPVSALWRSSCFVMTGVNAANTERCTRFIDLLQERFPGKDVYASSSQVVGYVKREGEGTFTVLAEEPPELDSCFGLCGIARPESFKTTVKNCGLTPLDFLILSDHHAYKKDDLRRIREQVRKSGARCIVTTEKDMVKLGRADFDVPVYGIRIEVEVPGRFTDMVLETIKAYINKKPSH